MNVIIANKNNELIQSITVDVIKKLEGEYAIEEVISTFKNFYFQRMILDITAIKNYKDIKTLQKLSIALDMDKIILLLDSSPESIAPEYLSKLISMGVYNFTQNSEGIMYLYNNPNTYRDVAHLHQLENINAEADLKFNPQVNLTGPRIIGFKNIVKGAGSTTLIYMIKRELEKSLAVVAVELDKRDFTYFNEKEMYSISSSEFSNSIAKHSSSNVILVDINESMIAENTCTEVYYVLEPSTIKLNRLMMSEPKTLLKHKEHRILLNQSMLSSKDVLDFEYESRMKIFYNMPALDEREKDIFALKGFLNKIGFKNNQSEETQKKNKLLGLFGL
jgi:hypothetical protein